MLREISCGDRLDFASTASTELTDAVQLLFVGVPTFHNGI